jgi:hypothetical protein
MAVFAIPLSAFGLSVLGLKTARVLVVLTAICAGAYVAHYFVIYPKESALAFENFDFKGSLHDALSRAPIRVILSADDPFQYINLRFFGSLAQTHAPLIIGGHEAVHPGDVYISHDPEGKGGRFFNVEGDGTRVVSAATEIH